MFHAIHPRLLHLKWLLKCSESFCVTPALQTRTVFRAMLTWIKNLRTVGLVEIYVHSSYASWNSLAQGSVAMRKQGIARHRFVVWLFLVVGTNPHRQTHHGSPGFKEQFPK